MDNRRRYTFRRFLQGFYFASKGLGTAFREQLNLWAHALAIIFVILAGYYFQITEMEWLVVVISVAMVLIAELFNTALEYLTDLVSPQQHPLAAKVKDVAAGAVLIAALFAAISGIIIFGKYIVAVYVQQM